MTMGRRRISLMQLSQMDIDLRREITIHCCCVLFNAAVTKRGPCSLQLIYFNYLKTVFRAKVGQQNENTLNVFLFGILL